MRFAKLDSRLVLLLLCPLLTTGCYLEATATGYGAGGGLSGPGFSAGINVGIPIDFDKGFERGGFGSQSQIGTVSASDGSVTLEHSAVEARLDVTLLGRNLDDGWHLQGTAAVSAAFWGRVKFHPPNTSTIYEGDSGFETFFLGATAARGTLGRSLITFALGPSVVIAPNDFVGNTTTIGLEARVGFFLTGGVGPIAKLDVPSVKPQGPFEKNQYEKIHDALDEEHRRENEEEQRRRH